MCDVGAACGSAGHWLTHAHPYCWLRLVCTAVHQACQPSPWLLVTHHPATHSCPAVSVIHYSVELLSCGRCLHCDASTEWLLHLLCLQQDRSSLEARARELATIKASSEVQRKFYEAEAARLVSNPTAFLGPGSLGWCSHCGPNKVYHQQLEGPLGAALSSKRRRLCQV